MHTSSRRAGRSPRPPPTSPGLSEDTPRLELPRSLRGFLLLGGLAPRIGTDAATKLISSRPRASSVKNSAAARKNARKLPIAGAVNYVVSTKNSPVNGWCLRGSLISVVPLPDDPPYACPPVGPPGVTARPGGSIPLSPFVHPSTTSPPPDARFQPLAPLTSNGTNANDSPDATPIAAEACGHLAAQIGGALPAHYEGRARAGQIWSCCPAWNSRRNKIDSDGWLAQA